MSWAQQRLNAIAQASANARYPLAHNPQPQDIDYQEAKRFLAMFDAVQRFGRHPSSEAVVVDLPYEGMVR